MKWSELFEGELDNFQEVLLLMKHGNLSREKAEALAKKLKEHTFFIRGKEHINARLRWVEDRLTGTLKFISADMPGSWRSGTAAMGRGVVRGILMMSGFRTAGFASQAIKREHSLQNAPHIFFWGPGSPAPKKENFEKVWGTEESLEKLRKKNAPET